MHIVKLLQTWLIKTDPVKEVCALKNASSGYLYFYHAWQKTVIVNTVALFYTTA